MNDKHSGVRRGGQRCRFVLLTAHPLIRSRRSGQTPPREQEELRLLSKMVKTPVIWRRARVLRRRPEQPTVAEAQEHEIGGHEPCRSWCRACVAGRGRADAHGGRPGVKKGVPIIEVDYGYSWSRAKEASDATQDEIGRRGSARWSPNLVASAL